MGLILVFSPVVCLVQLRCDSFCFILQFIEACSLQIRGRKGMVPDGRRAKEELGGVEGGETVIRTYCMRKEALFNKRGYTTD